MSTISNGDIPLSIPNSMNPTPEVTEIPMSSLSPLNPRYGILVHRFPPIDTPYAVRSSDARAETCMSSDWVFAMAKGDCGDDKQDDDRLDLCRTCYTFIGRVRRSFFTFFTPDRFVQGRVIMTNPRPWNTPAGHRRKPKAEDAHRSLGPIRRPWIRKKHAILWGSGHASRSPRIYTLRPAYAPD